MVKKRDWGEEDEDNEFDNPDEDFFDDLDEE